VRRQHSLAERPKWRVAGHQIERRAWYQSGLAYVGCHHGKACIEAVRGNRSRGQPCQARLNFHPQASGRRIARQQQEGQGAGAAANIQEVAIGRVDETREQNRIQAGSETAHGLDQLDPAAQKRVVRDILGLVRVVRQDHTLGSTGSSSGSMRAITKPVASLGWK